MRVKQFNVLPDLPGPLKHLREISMNHWFSWNREAAHLFADLDYGLWKESDHNPTWVLGSIDHSKLKKASGNKAYLTRLKRVYKRLEDYQRGKGWFDAAHPRQGGLRVAYFSMEFGLSAALPVYSGGLGVLAGDHLKAASDLGLPLTGIGLLYRKGYMTQRLNRDGWQIEEYPDNDWYNMPVEIVLDAQGRPVRVAVEIEDETVAVQVWRAKVGRVDLFLLDTNLPENSERSRQITDSLYGGDGDMRIRQEIVLGLGGVRALRALGVEPTVFHMNEGHSAFLVFERLRELMGGRKMTYAEAREVIWPSTVFTTHTPVPAGNEVFGADQLERYFTAFAKRLGLKWKDFMALGQRRPDPKANFEMTVLALRHAAFCNGVSEKHGEVSRGMWKDLWPGLPEQEVPISHITNGVHVRTWISHALSETLEKKAGPRFVRSAGDEDAWAKLSKVSDRQLWDLKNDRRDWLVRVCRERLSRQLARKGADITEIRDAERALDPNVFTIGFSRRFATYKRAGLFFHSPERLLKLLTDPKRPIQVIFSGKAHPADQKGKELIKQIFQWTRDPRLKNRLVFLENYDMNIARYLVHGVDLWLNTPLPPYEASGTSGMKAAMNGALNLSTYDGWWWEGYSEEVGWRIGSGEVYADEDEQRYVESEAIYNILERLILPMFYRRKGEVPAEWVKRMRASMTTLSPRFSAERMVREYVDRFYVPAHRKGRELTAGGGKKAKRLARWRHGVERNWKRIKLSGVGLDQRDELKTGQAVKVEVGVDLGKLAEADVQVEVCYGPLDAEGRIRDAVVLPMSANGTRRGAARVYRASIKPRTSGRYGFAVRALPRHPDLVHPHTPHLITWG